MTDDPGQSESILRAGPIEVDLADQRASLNGVPLKLGPKPFELLVTLMRTQQRLVTKDEIIELVWEGRAVSDAVLTTAMKDLRQALGDSARTPTYIETVHGRGYRFLLPVEEERVQHAMTHNQTATAIAGSRLTEWISDRNRFRSIAFSCAAVVAFIIVITSLTSNDGSKAGLKNDVDVPSIAVLPFDDLSAAGDQAYFSDGLTEEVLGELAQNQNLHVASRTSSFAFRDKSDITAPEIAKALGVDHVLEGSVRRSGDRVRVTAQLVNAQTDTHIWSQSYERPLSIDTLFEIQNDIATSIAQALNERFVSGSARSAPGTQNLEAYDLYLQARALFNARRNVGKSADLAKEATRIDPSFARAWELFASATFVSEGGAVTSEAMKAVQTALNLDPSLSLAHAIRGIMSNINPPYDWSSTMSDLKKAVSLDPKNTTALLWYGVELRKLGYLDQAANQFQTCLKVDPAYTRCRVHYLWTLHMQGETDAAFLEYDRLIADGDPPDDAVLLLAALERGDDQKAMQIISLLDNKAPMPPTVLRALKEQDVDLEVARQDLRNWASQTEFNLRDVYTIIYALGDYDLIEKVQGSVLGLWLPEFPEYRRSEHFNDFVRALQIDLYWRENGFPPQCKPVGEKDFVCN